MNEISANRFGKHNNSLGFLRLLFASLVILSHTPELLDGSRERELLTKLFGTLSFGEFAVDGFFVISGFLVFSSFDNSNSIVSYIVKRIVRIFPGFIVAFIFCILIVYPIGGGDLSLIPNSTPRLLVDLLFLQPPPNLGCAFYDTAYPALNGSAWTIAYEFRCYVLTCLLGSIGVRRFRMSIVFMIAMCLIGFVILGKNYHPSDYHVQECVIQSVTVLPWRGIIIGSMAETLRLTAMFLVGSCYYFFSSNIKFSRPLAVVATIGLCVGLSFQITAHPAVALFGGYLIFSIGSIGAPNVIAKINNESDISYGIYLYTWPITKIIQKLVPHGPLLMYVIFVFICSFIFGYLSWIMIEKPALSLIRGRKRPSIDLPPSGEL